MLKLFLGFNSSWPLNVDCDNFLGWALKAELVTGFAICMLCQITGKLPSFLLLGGVPVFGFELIFWVLTAWMNIDGL